MPRHRTLTLTVLVLVALVGFEGAATAERVHTSNPVKAPERIVFPVVGPVSYTDDFGEARAQGAHEANDIVALRHAPVVAAEAGRISVWNSSARAGCMLYLYGRSGATYLYVHLNNDLGEGNDNRGGCVEGVAYAAGLRDGQPVRAGQLIGYVGDSGDAEGAHPHLHFELHPGDGEAVSPYRWLRRAQTLLFASPDVAGDDAAASLPVTLALYGTVLFSAPSDPGGTLSIRVNRVRLSTGLRIEVARDVIVTIPPGAIVQRATGQGRATVALQSLTAGDRVIAWTAPLTATLDFQLAPPGVLAAAQVLLRS